MLHKSRAEAQSANANKYDTGKPCQNGHTGPRYTLSGVCVHCLRASQLRAAAAYEASLDPLRHDRAAFARNVVVAKERVPDNRYDALLSIADALLACRFPALVGHVDMRASPNARDPKGGTSVMNFLVHSDDRAALHLVCDEAVRVFGVDTVRLHVP